MTALTTPAPTATPPRSLETIYRIRNLTKRYGERLAVNNLIAAVLRPLGGSRDSLREDA